VRFRSIAGHQAWTYVGPRGASQASVNDDAAAVDPTERLVAVLVGERGTLALEPRRDRPPVDVDLAIIGMLALDVRRGDVDAVAERARSVPRADASDDGERSVLGSRETGEDVAGYLASGFVRDDVRSLLEDQVRDERRFARRRIRNLRTAALRDQRH